MKLKIPAAEPLDNEKKIRILIEELKRKDNIIDELKKENKILLKISLKKSEEKLSEKKSK